ncbi:glycosyltransferase family 4 protein [Bradyrhizobium diazoefficiens]|uniref:glycosyltransferase family 4 protein n=1 Tax=Bradyrhizobium diazoefficiens TaxID=1355477 RepID=UPI00272A47D4|nr:glycosyltransferase family 4 protein [Bradyrhizobium diazoefficiens]WLA67662.1 glycosyltransferase family 4 protein [Bradyrhizobium diazoefficiens]
MLRVMMLGLRGFPGVQGGVEAHAEHLCQLLRELDCDVEVVVRSAYVPRHRGGDWKGIRYLRIWSPKSRALETIVHSFLGVLAAAWRRPQVLHIQAIGPALMAPLARLFGLHVVVTHHGPDYDREKWGRFAKTVLRTGEALGMRFCNRRIVISRTIRNLIRDKYGLESYVIPNGVDLPELPSSTSALEQFGLTPGRYVLTVSRMVPEKRHKDLIAAYATAKLNGWKLVVIGASDHPDAYAAEVAALAHATPGVILGGFQTGLALCELYAHAGFFVLPSSHEGLPIVLLEALSYGLPVVASDLPAHQEIGLEAKHYFPLGDVPALAARLESFARMPWPAEMRESTRRWVAEHYDWRSVVKQTIRVYRRAVRSGEPELRGHRASAGD